MCDEPHPLLIKEMIGHCTQGKIDEAYKIMAHLWQLGYSPEDIITSIFRVSKIENMPEYLKLEFIKVIVVCKQIPRDSKDKDIFAASVRNLSKSCFPIGYK